jgi:L-amino acid N-acyltransferase YncA
MITPATWADIETIGAIYNEAMLEGGFTGHLEPLSVENRQAWYLEHQGRYAIFVKTADGSVVGYAAISSYRQGRGAFDETCEVSCYLAGAYRDRGFGKELIKHAVEHASCAGFRLVIATVLGGNQRSIGLLSGLGFSILGKLPNAAKINGTHFDHIYLCRSLR